MPANKSKENNINKSPRDHSNLYVDIAFVIDKSDPKIVAMAVDFIYFTLKNLIESAKEIDKNAIFRVKAVGFGDLSNAPFFETGFYNCDEYGAFLERLNTMQCGNGTSNCKVDTFEAICTALQSEWTTERRSRHCIIVLSNSITNEFGTNRKSKHYPPNTPNDFTTIAGWWNGMHDFSNTYAANSGRLISITYKHAPLTILESWNRYWPIYIGKSFNPVTDFACIFDLILGAF